MVLCDIGLTPAGGATVLGRFYSAAPGRTFAGSQCVTGRSRRTCASGSQYPPLGKSSHDAQRSAVSVESEKLHMDSQLIRRQP